jgi:hypothetical protein
LSVRDWAVLAMAVLAIVALLYLERLSRREK